MRDETGPAGDERLFQAVLAAAMRQAGLSAASTTSLFQSGKGLGESLGLSSASADILYAKAHALLTAGQFDEAARFFSAVLMIRPEDRNGRLGLAMALSGKGLFTEAVHLLEPLSTDFPDDPVILIRCMDMQMHTGARDAARRTLSKLQMSNQSALPPSLARLGRQIAALLAP